MMCNQKRFGAVLFLALCSILYFYNSTRNLPVKPIKKKYTYRSINFNKDAGDVFSFVHVQKTGGTTIEKHLVFNIENSNCECRDSKKPSCMCYRKDVREIWLVCRYIQPKWPCGLHPDFATLRECTPKLFNTKYENRKRRYFYGTILRNPLHRFLSEFRHIQRGASWEAASSLCRGRLLIEQIPACFAGKFWHNLTIEKFISCPYNLAINRQTWMLSNISAIDCDFKKILQKPNLEQKLLNIAKRNIRNIAYFGLLEYPQESQFIFEKTFSMKFKEPFQLWDTGFANEYIKTFKQSDEMLERLQALNSLDVKLYKYAKQIFFERYNYFARKYGIPKYHNLSVTGKFSMGDVRLERIKQNLPRSLRKEEVLRQKREKDLLKGKKKKEKQKADHIERTV